jgi:hypothetical protein
MDGLRVGLADHLGWAVCVTASADGHVVDRRRLELIEPGLPAAPIHHLSGVHPLHGLDSPPDDAVLERLVSEVRASVVRATTRALDQLSAELPAPIEWLALREWPADFPKDLAVLRRAPYESRADPVMYRQVLADSARARGWTVDFYQANGVEAAAARILGSRADRVLHGPRAALGPPWSRDHRTALAATIAGA